MKKSPYLQKYGDFFRYKVTFASKWGVEGLLRFGHARALIPHCGIIHYPRAASLRRPLQFGLSWVPTPTNE